MRISTPEATAFDLVCYFAASGYAGNVATVLSELSEKLDPAALVKLADLYATPRGRGGGPLIPRAQVTAWRARAPWPSDAQIEQDLILYQRKKGRDFYDLWLALTSLEIDDRKVVKCFERYLDHDGLSISRAEFEKNLAAKLNDPAFLEDITPLLPAGVDYNPRIAGSLIQKRFIDRLRGKPWKGRSKKNDS